MKKENSQKVFRFRAGSYKMAIFASNIRQARRYIRASHGRDLQEALKFEGTGDPAHPEDNWVAANARGY